MKNSSKQVPRSPCAISNVLDIFGDKWTLLVVRDLIFYGKHEYKEFLASPEGIATNILSDRLKRLCKAEIINEMAHPENKSRKLYYLTPKGKALLPILKEMLVWGQKFLPYQSEVMKPIYERMNKEPGKFVKEILKRLSDWERQFVDRTI